jgi:O-antigen ligase
MNTGVTTNKNSLGAITLVLSLGAVWRILTLLRAKGDPDRNRRLLAQVTLLAFGLGLLALAHSATAAGCFALGTGLMLTTALPAFRSRPAAVHALIAVMALTTALALMFGVHEQLAQAMGRTSDFTGRRQIWTAVVAAAPNPLFGAGYESFWLGSRLDALRRELSLTFTLNSSHNGYLEVYVNLGVTGLVLLALILASGYRHATSGLRRDPALGTLQLAYLVTAAIYSLSEAGFRMLSPTWVFLLLATMTSPRVSQGVERAAAPPPDPSRLARTIRWRAPAAGAPPIGEAIAGGGFARMGRTWKNRHANGWRERNPS